MPIGQMRRWALFGGLSLPRRRFFPWKPSAVGICSGERLILVKAIPRGDLLSWGGSGRSLRDTKHRNQTDSQHESGKSGGANETEFHFSLLRSTMRRTFSCNPAGSWQVKN